MTLDDGQLLRPSRAFAASTHAFSVSNCTHIYPRERDRIYIWWRCTCTSARGIHRGAAKENQSAHHVCMESCRHTSSLHSSFSGRSGSRAVAHCAYASASRRHDDGDDTVSATAANKLFSSVVPPLAHAYGTCRVHRTIVPPPPPRTPPPPAAAAAAAAAATAARIAQLCLSVSTCCCSPSQYECVWNDGSTAKSHAVSRISRYSVGRGGTCDRSFM